MEVNESNSQWTFPSIFRSIPNFLKTKSNLLRKVQRTCLCGLSLRECSGRCCIPPWRWLHEFVNRGDNIDSLWKKKCCLYILKLNLQRHYLKKGGGGEKGGGGGWGKGRGGGGKEKEERRTEKRKEKQQSPLSSTFRLEKARTIFFFPWSTSPSSPQMPIEKVLGWITSQECCRRIRQSGWKWEITYIRVVRKIMDFLGSGGRDLELLSASSIRKSREGEGY